MGTQCYAMVRGSSLRVTGLDATGALGPIDAPAFYVVSRSVSQVRLEEVAESGSNEMIRNEADARRLLLVKPGQMIRYKADINLINVDPGLISLVTGVPVVVNDAGDVVGFDANTKVPAKAFALEVWSRLAGQDCGIRGEQDAGFGEGPFGEFAFGGGDAGWRPRQWGYTIFPFLKGGILSGCRFENGLVSFSIRGAQTQRMNKWGTGPYAVGESPTGVSRNTQYRQAVTTTPPPLPSNGIDSVYEGGSASMTSDGVIDGQFVVTSADVVDGGEA